MDVIAWVFGSLLVLVWAVGIIVTVLAQEIAKMVGLAIVVYGTIACAALFLITVVVHDHVHFGVH